MLKTLGSHVRGNVVAYIALFIALGGTTYAATGQPFTLGQSNTANAPTSLTASPSFAGKALQVTNTNTGAGATALGLNVASGHAPFTVNSPTKVANLNADQLDGLDSTSFVPSSGFRRVGPVATTPPSPNGLDEPLVRGEPPLDDGVPDRRGDVAVAGLRPGDGTRRAGAHWPLLDRMHPGAASSPGS